MFTGIILSLGGALTHSISFISRKKGLEVANYKVFVLFRVVIGILVAGPILWLLGPGLSGLSFKISLPFILTGGLAGGLIALFTTTLAIHYIGASKTHAITASTPLVTALGEVLFLGATLTLPLGLGTVFIVVGAALISFLLHQEDEGGENSKTNRSNRPILGLGLALYTVIAIGAQMALQKWGLAMGATPLQGLFLHNLSAAILFSLYVPFLKPDLDIENLGKLKYSGNFLIAAVAMAILPLLNLYAMAFLSATVVSALMRVAPLFTIVLSYFFLQGIESVNWKIGLSTVLIVAGAILVSLH